jgi:hypothetical protein
VNRTSVPRTGLSNHCQCKDPLLLTSSKECIFYLWFWYKFCSFRFSVEKSPSRSPRKSGLELSPSYEGRAKRDSRGRVPKSLEGFKTSLGRSRDRDESKGSSSERRSLRQRPSRQSEKGGKESESESEEKGRKRKKETGPPTAAQGPSPSDEKGKKKTPKKPVVPKKGKKKSEKRK